MSEFLPKEVRRELAAAKKAACRRKSHMRVRTGGQDFAILRYWESGFSLDADTAPALRGLVDLYDHGKHLCQALIVTSSEDDGERVFEFKSATHAARTAPPADFVREAPEPAGLLTKH